MLKSEIHNALKLELDKTSSLQLPAFEPEELDYWFDQGARMLTEELYLSYLKNGHLSKLQDELKFLISHAEVDTASTIAQTGLGEGNMYELALAGDEHFDDFILELFVQSTTKNIEDGTTASSAWMPCKRISIDEIDKYLTTPFNTPYFEQPVFYLSEADPATSTLFHIIVDNFTGGLGNSIRVSYLRYPDSLSSYTTAQDYEEFPLHVMHNIIKKTSLLMLDNIESPRIQTTSQLTNNNN